MAFPRSPLPVGVDLYLGAGLGWVDVTADVRLSNASSGGGITLTRGRRNEGSQPDPSELSLTLNNRLGKYSNRNPGSPYFGLLGRNTPIRVGVDLAADTFGRTVASGWGTSDSGRVWSTGGAAVADFTVASGYGTHLHPTKNIVRVTYQDQAWTDVEQACDVSIPAVATGASVVTGHIARYNPATNTYYWLRLEFNTTGTLTCKISKTVSGVMTELASSPLAGAAYTAGQVWRLRTSISGGHLAVRAWASGQPEPNTWALAVSDRSLTAPGRAGMATWAVGGNTNTGLQVRFDGYKAVLRRCVLEVASWPQRWDISGKDRWTPIQAAGILRRLGQGKAPSRSPLRRAIGGSAPVAYWPAEDGDAAVQAGSAITGHPPLTIAGTPKFVAIEDSTFGANPTLRYGTSGLLDLSGGASLTASVPAGVTAATAAAWTVAASAAVNYAVASGDVVVADVATPGGTYVRWQLIIRKATLRNQVVAYDPAGTATTVIDDPGVYTTFAHYDFSVWQNGPNISVGYGWYLGSYSLTASLAGTLAGVTSIAVNPTRITQSTEMPFGHIALWSRQPIPILETTYDSYGTLVYGAAYSWFQEAATDRLARLCAEEGIPLDMPAVSADAVVRMGWQPVGTFAELLGACVEADGGLLFEARDQLGLVYRPCESLYNQTGPTLSYSDGHIGEPFEPVDDDDTIVNDITVSRRDGSSVRAVQPDGPLAAVPPPAGVGVYQSSVELNLADDSQLRDQAWWRLHLGTIDESRYPRIKADLSSAAWAADPAFTAQAAALDSGDMAVIDGLPAWLPPGPTTAMIQGSAETLDAYDWDITWVATPGSPWDIATADGPQRAPADGSTLAAGVTAAATTLSIASAATNGVWTTDTTDFPLDIRIGGPGGERVTLSAISGTSSPQTATVSARAVNGVSRDWPAGAEVDVWQPAVAPL